ncbi:DUF1289 domain-containing protein [Alteromonas mediterranea]|uniref:DUF1289 domain-containing protein n=1 Tax=Alteromonas mediterranea TaxID=314275 RepID=UPI00113065B0|nr:DUF1289 domain-containing protein [Alteromonas mediterranea]QDG34357.1 DUF1289 domain-containing protein [Alteromonas mediterranea]
MNITSPCIALCKLDDDVCSGCNRTIEEITNWRTYTNSQKQAVISRLFALKNAPQGYARTDT